MRISKSKLAFAVVAAPVVLSLSGCSLLYPHWGATGLPSDTPSSSQSASTEPSATATDSATPTPSATPVQLAKMHIIQSNLDATAGVIDVIAEVTNAAEDGGTCTLSITSGAVTKSQTVKAEINVDSTQCFPMEVTLSGLPKGPASFKVTYSSKSFAGTTGPQAVTIQ